MDDTIPYVAPGHGKSAFNCPHCSAFAAQIWGHIYITGPNVQLHNSQIATCSHCGRYTYWIDRNLIYPIASIAPKPNADLPEDIKRDYQEARSILVMSPRGAAALLRLAIQKLCAYLGESGKNINSDIQSLVKKGLPVQIQRALDTVRVVGNNAVHPGQIDLSDDPDIAGKLFGLVNLIAQFMITQPKLVDEVYQNTVPESDRLAIDKRDSK